jgi:DeoR/GlpR family transcriptional regulator of sugar metabolism
VSHLTIYERRQSLSELLRKQPGLRIPELAKALGISEGTVRNDLNALASAQQVLGLVGSIKLGKEDLTSFATIDQINHLFIDDGLTDEWRARLLQAGISFTICSEDRPVL